MGLSFIGKLLNTYLPVSIPASIYRIVILFFALIYHVIKLEDVEETGMFLTLIMGITGVVIQFILNKNCEN